MCGQRRPPPPRRKCLDDARSPGADVCTLSQEAAWPPKLRELSLALSWLGAVSHGNGGAQGISHSLRSCLWESSRECVVAIYVLSQIALCPVHYGMFSSTPGFYPLDASIAIPLPPPVVTTNPVFRHGQMSPGGFGAVVLTITVLCSKMNACWSGL
jgi:hypothetical protein